MLKLLLKVLLFNVIENHFERYADVECVRVMLKLSLKVSLFNVTEHHFERYAEVECVRPVP